MKKALISVSDKSNLENLAKGLKDANFEIIATGSTASAIKSFGIDCLTVEDVTGFNEILGGRVKTLHPKIHGGILANLDLKEHKEELEKLNIPQISIVVCNLYPFEKVLENPNASHSELIENIDIGGVTLIRAASKNHNHVALVCDPEDYDNIVDELKTKGEVSSETRLNLATKGFIQTAKYDIMIANYFQKKNETKDALLISATLKNDLRYGENPHQKAGYYGNNKKTAYSIETSEILWGKALSFNNIYDLEAGLMTLKEFDKPCSVAIKHNTPCGVGVGEDIFEAYENCYNADPVSIFGGIVSLNRQVDENLATKLNEIFLEIVLAPSFTEGALEILKKKKNLRILKIKIDKIEDKIEVKSVQDGFLVQDTDLLNVKNEELKVVTENKSEIDFDTLIFLQNICKFAKSNAIVIGQKGLLLGIGGGETNRIDACKLAMDRALKNVSYKKDEPLFLASDAFFPFEDIIEFVKDHNVKYIIQPGGSIRDKYVIEEANKVGIEIVFTGVRHFKH
ncbi:MAG: bifunctional phosphoribosylaminoimidazolecarboxamide formyltransferase/IMP cyclohydrolase [Lachnospirales bacterium]